MAADTDKLHAGIIVFYREELRTRYTLKNLRRFHDFDEAPDDTLLQLRAYFLDHIYPPPEDRAHLDRAFDQLGKLLRSPKRMRPLVGTALGSLWTLGRRLPGAISAGRSTFDAYAETRKLERYMLEEALRRDYGDRDLADHGHMLALIANVPEKDVRRLIRDITNLFHSLTNVELLRTSEAIMRRAYDVMDAHHDIYDADERAGLALGIDLLGGGLRLFESMDRRLFPPIIQGIEAVEDDWYKQVREHAGAARPEGGK